MRLLDSILLIKFSIPCNERVSLPNASNLCEYLEYSWCPLNSLKPVYWLILVETILFFEVVSYQCTMP